jgi:hypothetical protein
MNTSEDPNDRLIDSLLSEQAKGKPDEALLRAIASKMQAPPKAKSLRRNLDFFWPATAAAVVLLTAGGLLWSAFEKPDEEAGKLVEAPGPDPEKAPEKSGDIMPVAAPGEEKIAVQDEETPLVVAPEVAEAGEVKPGADPEIAEAGNPKPVLDQESGGGVDKRVEALNALRYVRDESVMWYVQFGFESEGKWAPKLAALAADKKRRENKVSALDMLKPGDTFFKEGFMAGRFKFIGITERQVISERTKLTHIVKFAQYEDLKPNKKGEWYESQYGLPEAGLNASAYFDRTAVMEFEGKEFKVEERTRFSLPPGGGGEEFLLKQVTPEKLAVEFKGADGKMVVREIAR